jgi:hypothetical protein
VLRRHLILLLAVACATALAGPLVGAANAETLRVTSTADQGPGSLGETILEAGPGDVIAIPPGRYPLTNGETLVEQGNTLRGAGVDQTTIVPTGGGEALAPGSGVTVTGAAIDAPLQAREDEESRIETKAQIIALIATVAIFLLILDLVRRRRLAERYALLWMLAAVVLLALAIWTEGLEVIADAMGIAEPANAIFILAFGVAFVLLLHFSIATSRLSEETKILAQEVTRLDQELREERADGLPGELREERGEPSSATTADQ